MSRRRARDQVLAHAWRGKRTIEASVRSGGIYRCRQVFGAHR